MWGVGGWRWGTHWPVDNSRISWPALVSRWAIGMLLVSWRYLWQVMPLHRTERQVPAADLPRGLPHDLDVERLQPLGTGRGPLYHRTFRVRIVEARLGANDLMALVLEDPGRLMPREVVRIRAPRRSRRQLVRNDDFVVDMPGPWNGPVRVVDAEQRRLHLVTLRGHLEAGEIEFRAHDDGPAVVFEIEAWAQPAGRLVQLLYGRLRLAKEIQLNMWLRSCRGAARLAGGRPDDGVRIETLVAPAPGARPPGRLASLTRDL